jgi:hypothetical protein
MVPALVVGVCVAARVVAGGEPALDDPDTFFELKVRPVLAGSCIKCHGPKKASGGLRLDSREAMLKGGDNGPVIVPGDPEASPLVVAIRHDDEVLKMPPTKPLPKAVTADLTAWVASGAPWPRASAINGTIQGANHWAFEPLRTDPPPPDPSGWSDQPIDRFLAAGHREHGLRPVEQADRRTLIRRASFDLIGLPPTPAQVEAFAADASPNAFEKLIDALLASPQYGERWGRFWLDLARYADTAGDNSDYPIPRAYLYRDYVIDAFNADVPYDRFLHEQLAGDILARQGAPEDYARLVTATGFIAQAKRFGTRKLEDMHQIIEDTLHTTSQVTLGLSLRCARCHDHKFDPITAKDYYALYGIFASTKYPFAGAEEDRRASEMAPLIPPDAVAAREAAHVEEIARLKDEIKQIETDGELGRKVAELAQQLTEAEETLNGSESSTREEHQRAVELLKAEHARAKDELDKALKPKRDHLARREKASPLDDASLAYAVREGTPTDVKLQKGGDPRTLGELVKRGVPQVLDPGAELAIPEGGSGRLALAQWLTGPVRHLTARVMVNRIWQHHFGKPIVATPSDFGLRGTPPTHPELLDWLARDFIESGWSIKAMHRRIMLSKGYQLACTHDPANAEADSGNVQHWRADRHPLDAEALRDTLLALGGNLDTGRPGPHPFPPMDQWRYTAHHQFKAVYPSDHRSVYLMVQRLQPHPYLSLFNGPDTSMSTAVRDHSTVPLQALFLLNSPFVHDQAERFAHALIEQEPNPESRIKLAYLSTVARPPSDAEHALSSTFLDQYTHSLDSESLTPDQRERQAWTALARTLLASNEFIYVD